jgi:hypothetical protein
MLKEFGFVKAMVWSRYACLRGRLIYYYVQISNQTAGCLFHIQLLHVHKKRAEINSPVLSDAYLGAHNLTASRTQNPACYNAGHLIYKQTRTS